MRDSLITSDPTEVVAAYEKGFVGAYADPSASLRLQADIESAGGNWFGEDACRLYGTEGAGAGKLTLTYKAVEQHFPNAIPGRAQERGDCVSFSTRSAIWMSYMAELVYGRNEQRDSIPTLSSVAENSGCIASETFYWNRGHGGEGWACADAADVALTKSGMWIRKNYPEIGIDLTDYSAAIAGKWGAKPPPDNILEIGRRNLCRNVTVCRTYESVRDMLATGNAISSCGSEAFSKERNKYGVAARDKARTWYHAMAYGAVDDRPETIAREGCGLVLVINSWGKSWQSGSRVIPGLEEEIPYGCFWARWDDLHNRTAIAFGASNGWQRSLPDWGLRGIV